MSEKWGRRFFNAGAVFLLLLGLAHSLSLLGTPAPKNETERQLMDLMSTYRFPVMGSMRSMNDFLRGFSISFMLAALGIGGLDLFVVRERPQLLRRVALINVLWLAAMTCDSVRYFFVAPSASLALALLIFFLAWLNLPHEP